jgi:hypothetical protein
MRAPAPPRPLPPHTLPSQTAARVHACWRVGAHAPTSTPIKSYKLTAATDCVTALHSACNHELVRCKGTLQLELSLEAL